jgi:hypothetical protein
VQYQVAAPTATSNRVCTSCTVASDCGTGTAFVFNCSSGFTDSFCAPCRPEAGFYQDEVCVCVCVCFCVMLFHSLTDFVLQPGQTACKAVQNCSAGFFQVQAATATSQTVCAACSSALCQAGQYLSSPCDEQADRVCLPCDGVTGYQDAPGQSSCKPITSCLATEFELAPPTASTNRVCQRCTTPEDCSAGSFFAGNCSAPCQACPPGSYQDEVSRCEMLPSQRFVIVNLTHVCAGRQNGVQAADVMPGGRVCDGAANSVQQP